MPFRDAFDCLWCGRHHRTRTSEDVEGWAALCPECIGRAGENGFLRYRLRAALSERARSEASSPSAAATAGRLAAPARADATSIGPRDDPAHGGADAAAGAEMRAYYAARAPEYDDWYVRRGRYARGPVHDLAWQMELDEATQWLDAQPLRGEIVELAAGTGWWSPLLAQKGELSLYDAVPETLDLARERLVAHGLRAHIHVRDAWDAPDRAVDSVFCGFWLGHVPRPRLRAFLGLVRAWLKPGGTFTFIDSRPDPGSGETDQPPVDDDEVAVRRVADGREFRVPEVSYEPVELETALRASGFASATVRTTARFFLLGRAAVSG